MCDLNDKPTQTQVTMATAESMASEIGSHDWRAWPAVIRMRHGVQKLGASRVRMLRFGAIQPL